MKHKVLLTLPLTMLLTAAIEKPYIDPSIPFNPDITFKSIFMSLDPIGPCEEYGSDITLTGRLDALGEYTGIRERIQVAPKGGSYSYAHTNSSHNVEKNVPYNFSLPIPVHSMLSSNGIDCKVILLDSSSKELSSYTFSLKPITKERINVSDYLRTYYQAVDTVVDPDKYSTSNSEKYIFNGFIDYFNEDNYYRLNLNKLKITYSCPKPFPGCSAKLRFTDYNNIFPNLNNGNLFLPFQIPLRTVVNGSQISFDFPEQMYVNPKTLEMSIVAKPDYRLTKYFYLPINKKESLIDQVFTLDVSNFGHNKVSFSWGITYLNDRNLIGDCYNSDYCVVGEIE